MAVTVRKRQCFYLRSFIYRSLHTSLPSVSGSEKDPGSGVIFESKNKVVANAQPSLGSWGNVQISQQVSTPPPFKVKVIVAYAFSLYFNTCLFGLTILGT